MSETTGAAPAAQHYEAAPRLSRLLLTGAAGGLGKVLRERLQPMAKVIRLSDVAEMAPAAGPHEEVAPCNLADKKARDYLAQQMEKHFFGTGADVATGYVPPAPR